MISVCMATYNGAAFVADQLHSILEQLSLSDEVIVVDDQSTDQTRQIVTALADPRLHLFVNPNNLGVVTSFERALSLSLGDYIFFADQDDIWLPHKVQRFLEAFDRSGKDIILSDCRVVDERLELLYPSFFSLRGSRLGLLNNVLKNSYVGCNMALTARMKKYVLPFPKRIPMHDQWVGILGDLHGTTALLPEPTLLWRRHDRTQTGLQRGTVVQMLGKRVRLLLALIQVGSRQGVVRNRV